MLFKCSSVPYTKWIPCAGIDVTFSALFLYRGILHCLRTTTCSPSTFPFLLVLTRLVFAGIEEFCGHILAPTDQHNKFNNRSYYSARIFEQCLTAPLISCNAIGLLFINLMGSDIPACSGYVQMGGAMLGVGKLAISFLVIE